jgi:hypothetical protein
MSKFNYLKFLCFAVAIGATGIAIAKKAHPLASISTWESAAADHSEGMLLVAETDPIACSSDFTQCDKYKPSDNMQLACNRQYQACRGVTDTKTCSNARNICLSTPKS